MLPPVIARDLKDPLLTVRGSLRVCVSRNSEPVDAGTLQELAELLPPVAPDTGVPVPMPSLPPHKGQRLTPPAACESL
jgi:hypothetical protein